MLRDFERVPDDHIGSPAHRLQVSIPIVGRFGPLSGRLLFSGIR